MERKSKTGKLFKQCADSRPYKTHRIKLMYGFADDILTGRKTFEVRKNDRGYQTGDHVIFKVITKGGEACKEHPLNSREYEITYVIDSWGIKIGYVVFGIKEAEV